MIKNTPYFEDIQWHILQELRKAVNSVKICVAWINLASYNRVLKDLLDKGVSVEIVYNNDHINGKAFLNIDPRIVVYPVRARLYGHFMHNKFCIIDNQVVLTGSFNWSKRAFNHFENIVVIEKDFRLVKGFLHEFEDLKVYYSQFNQQSSIRCIDLEDNRQCRSNSYNIGILGGESGKYDESLVQVWNICFTHGHITFIGEQYEQYLHSYLGIKGNEDMYGDYDTYNEYVMLSEFHDERDLINNIQKYFNKNREIQIHAIGRVVMSNPNEHLEWGEDPDYVVQVNWRSMYYRKLIPDTLYDEADIIINKYI